jgi:hypothetical protein
VEKSHLARISRTFVGRNEQTQTLPELRSLHHGYFREHGINGENCVCAVPARLDDLVPAFWEMRVGGFSENLRRIQVDARAALRVPF